jgi:uncharacterized membrane protein
VDELVVRIGPAERAALKELSQGENGDIATVATEALRTGLAAMRAEPAPEARPWTRVHNRRETRMAFLAGAGIGLVVVLVGGYGYKWSWTGFADNNQLWDWLQLLVLPIAFGTFAVWLKHGSRMSRRRRLMLAAAVVAFAAFVAAGYLVPLDWTGFRGNTLWDWLTLLLLPLALVTVQLWPSTARELGGWHVVFGIALAVALVVTLIGGYAGNWTWTGYPGNTLWDWISLVLGPVVIATLVIPAAVRWVSGNPEAAPRAVPTGTPPRRRAP